VIIEQLERGAAVVLIRLRSMGDMVLTTPALALLRAARPDLRLYVVLEPVWRRLLAGNSDVSEVLPPRLGEVRRLRPALCLNLHGGSTSAWLTALSGARWRAGFGHFRYPFVYNVRIPRAQEILGRATDAPIHTAEHLASAMFYLGVPPAEIPRLRLFASPRPRPRPYAVLHTGAAHATKQWPGQRFAELGAWLRDTQGLEPVLVSGPEFGTLDELMSLIAGAELFVGNDSGPAHVAAAFGVPAVVIFGPSNARVWHPWRAPHRVVESAPAGIGSLDSGPVRAAVLSLLGARTVLQA
jgi:ADP-heptose:LPS heptosyltransferase